MTPRAWLAWRLVRLAHRLNDTTYQETVVVSRDGQKLAEITITGDDYGCGLFSYHTATAGVVIDTDDDGNTGRSDGKR